MLSLVVCTEHSGVSHSIRLVTPALLFGFLIVRPFLRTGERKKRIRNLTVMIESARTKQITKEIKCVLRINEIRMW